MVYVICSLTDTVFVSVSQPPGPHLIKKEFVVPRSHKGREQLGYVIGLHGVFP